MNTNISGYKVNVPYDMTVQIEPKGFDHILYRGCEIYLMDTCDLRGDTYEGGFIVELPGGAMQDVNSLGEARKLIDEVSKPKLPKSLNVPESMTVTIAQAQKLYQKWLQLKDCDNNKTTFSFDEWLNYVSPTYGCDDAVTIYWCGMWLCIEKDGYCHS